MTSHSKNNMILKGFGFARVRDKAFASVRDLWSRRQTEGMTQADLAARLGKDPAWVSRKLSGPTNWTLRTLGDLTDALDGEVEIKILDIHSQAVERSNYDAYVEYQAICQDAKHSNQMGQSTQNNTLPVAA
jgi:transcriptional regulator with XRE-family HTH domain